MPRPIRDSKQVNPVVSFRVGLPLRFVPHSITVRVSSAGALCLFVSLLVGSLLTGCKSFHLQHHEYVYVAARQVYLHDRVAAVSNRVGQVTNGEALELVERGKRFVKVRTPKGEVGWLEDHAIIDDKLYGQFQDLGKKHAQDQVVANGELRDDLYLHVQPGRESPHFLLIPGNTKVQLLERGTVPKTAAPGTASPAKSKTSPVAATKDAAAGKLSTSADKPVKSSASEPQSASASAPFSSPSSPQTSTIPGLAVPMPAVPMEDWWLVRDTQGHTGWLLAGRIDVDVPDEVGAYAEGQRMVGAYPIAKVIDDNAGRARRGDKGADSDSSTDAAKQSISNSSGALTDGAGAAPIREFTEYVTVLTPPRGGLPYDFDQMRVFVWSLNHHRYETAYRLHGIQGYLPVKLSHEMVNGESEPSFSFQIASGPNVSVDPETGVTRPVAPRTLAFRLEGNLVKRTGADQAPIVLTHDSDEPGKKKSGRKKR